tara:strand:+ start:338510 stop:338749 length:240 start_codon:yes stop_codon:yes gene_type:complete
MIDNDRQQIMPKAVNQDLVCTPSRGVLLGILRIWRGTNFAEIAGLEGKMAHIQDVIARFGGVDCRANPVLSVKTAIRGF